MAFDTIKIVNIPEDLKIDLYKPNKKNRGKDIKIEQINAFKPLSENEINSPNRKQLDIQIENMHNAKSIEKAIDDFTNLG